MTVSSTTIKTSPYACDGATIQFSFPFAVWDSSEVKVILRTVATGAETTLTETTHYSVTLSTATPSAGYITTVSTYSSAYEIVIKANFPNTQEVDYGEGDTFPASSHEEALDRGVRLVQQINEKLTRSILFPESTTLEDIELPEISASNANYYLKVNNAGSAIEWADLVAYGSLTTHDANTLGDSHDAMVPSAIEAAAMNEGSKVITPALLGKIFQYQTIQVPASSFRPAETTAGTQSTQEYPNSFILRDYIEFENYNDESVAYDVTLWLPDTWDRATLKVMAAWMGHYSAGLHVGSRVEFGYQVKAFNAGSRIDTNWSTPPTYVIDAVTNTASDTEEETGASANIASSVADSFNRIDVRVTRRNTMASNNMASPAWITGLLFQYVNSNQCSAW